MADVPAAIAFWRAYFAELRGDAERAIASDRQALAELSEGSRCWRPSHLHAAGLLRGVLPAAERAFASSMAEFRAAGEVYLALRARELIGHVQRAQGRLDAAVGTYRQGLEIAAPTGGPHLPVAGIARVGLAEVAYQRSELDTAREHATEGIALCGSSPTRGPRAVGLAFLALIRQAEGDLRGPLEAIEEDWGVAPSLGVTGLLNPVPAS